MTNNRDPVLLSNSLTNGRGIKKLGQSCKIYWAHVKGRRSIQNSRPLKARVMLIPIYILIVWSWVKHKPPCLVFLCCQKIMAKARQTWCMIKPPTIPNLSSQSYSLYSQICGNIHCPPFSKQTITNHFHFFNLSTAAKLQSWPKNYQIYFHGKYNCQFLYLHSYHATTCPKNHWPKFLWLCGSSLPCNHFNHIQYSLWGQVQHHTHCYYKTS